jgi:hypothetical protein
VKPRKYRDHTSPSKRTQSLRQQFGRDLHYCLARRRGWLNRSPCTAMVPRSVRQIVGQSPSLQLLAILVSSLVGVLDQDGK